MTPITNFLLTIMENKIRGRSQQKCNTIFNPFLCEARKWKIGQKLDMGPRTAPNNTVQNATIAADVALMKNCYRIIYKQILHITKNLPDIHEYSAGKRGHNQPQPQTDSLHTAIKFFKSD